MASTGPPPAVPVTVAGTSADGRCAPSVIALSKRHLYTSAEVWSACTGVCIRCLMAKSLPCSLARSSSRLANETVLAIILHKHLRTIAHARTHSNQLSSLPSPESRRLDQLRHGLLHAQGAAAGDAPRPGEPPATHWPPSRICPSSRDESLCISRAAWQKWEDGKGLGGGRGFSISA